MNRSILPPRPIAPDVYEGQVADAQLVSYSWRASASNPDGLAVRIGVAVEGEDGPAHVFDAVDVTNRDRLVMIFAACGLEAPASPDRAIDSLIGRPCRVVTRNIKPRLGKHSGGLKAVVSSWVPCPQ